MCIWHSTSWRITCYYKMQAAKPPWLVMKNYWTLLTQPNSKCNNTRHSKPDNTLVHHEEGQFNKVCYSTKLSPATTIQSQIYSSGLLLGHSLFSSYLLGPSTFLLKAEDPLFVGCDVLHPSRKKPYPLNPSYVVQEQPFRAQRVNERGTILPITSQYAIKMILNLSFV